MTPRSLGGGSAFQPYSASPAPSATPAPPAADSTATRERGGTDAPCLKCNGRGRRLYSHGSTWRGGVSHGGTTLDLCDVCWGSGDAEHPLRDLRAWEAEHEAERARSALDELASRFSPPYLRADVLALVEVLRKIDDGSVARTASFGTKRLAGALASMLAEITTKGGAR